jgi:hypothetical protein
MALAASVVVAVVVVSGRKADPVQPGPVVVVPPAPAPSPPSAPAKPLGDSVTEATDAIVNLTKRAASETREGSARLVPSPWMPELPDAGEGLEPLANAGTGAARSVEPLASSARRAVNFFLRAADPPARPN